MLPRLARPVLRRGGLCYSTAAPRESSPAAADLNAVLSEAEKVVGYPASFLNLRFLLSDEFANLAFHLRKLIGTSHPLLQTAKDVIAMNRKPTYSLIVLLVSKAGGLPDKFPDNEIDTAAGILYSQRSLAEVAEMMRTSNLIHRSVLNFNCSERGAADVNYGNKIALLCGDYILSNCFHTLARMRNQSLNEIMSYTLRDLSEANFFGPHDSQNKPLPGKPVAKCNDSEQDRDVIPNSYGVVPINVRNVLGTGRPEWTLRTLLSGGTLLGQSCQGALKLARHDRPLQEKAYIFGSNLALAWQAFRERDALISGASFSLVSAPVLLHLQHDPGLYEEIEKGARDVRDVDHGLVRKAVTRGPAMEEALNLQNEHADAALEILAEFPVEDARSALATIINSLKE